MVFLSYNSPSCFYAAYKVDTVVKILSASTPGFSEDNKANKFPRLENYVDGLQRVQCASKDIYGDITSNSTTQAVWDS